MGALMRGGGAKGKGAAEPAGTAPGALRAS